MERALQSWQMLPTDGAADHVGLSVSTLEKLRLTGDGPIYVKLGRRVLYRLEDLEDWVAAHRYRSTSEYPESRVPLQAHGQADAAQSGQAGIDPGRGAKAFPKSLLARGPPDDA